MAQLPSFDSVRKENLLKAVLKDKFARCAFWVLVVLYLSVFLSPFIIPYSKEYSNRDKAYCPLILYLGACCLMRVFSSVSASISVSQR